MRYLILSDIHANWHALAAVLEAVSGEDFDGVLMLGDLVGYGALPNEVVDAVRQLPYPVTAVRGNHDKVAVGIDDGTNFNKVAQEAALWTEQRLTSENRDYIQRLPQGPMRVGGTGASICHGSPLDEDAYILSAEDARQIFLVDDSHVIFFGHSHLLSSFTCHDGRVAAEIPRGPSGFIRLHKGGQYLLNPGSVGQPRDHDPRASFMTFDVERGEVEWRRVEYAVATAQRSILSAGLSPVLAQRLRLGV